MKEKFFINARIIDPSQNIDEVGGLIVDNNGKIQKGYFADFMNIKKDELDFIEIDEDSILDYLIFASPKNIINNVWVKGKCS